MGMGPNEQSFTSSAEAGTFADTTGNANSAPRRSRARESNHVRRVGSGDAQKYPSADDARKLAEDKKKAAEEVKPLDTSAFPSLGGAETSVKEAPAAKSWHSDKVAESKKRE